jgi:hypothetical protein
VPNASGVAEVVTTGAAAALAAAPLAGSDRAPLDLVDGGWLAGAALRCTSGADERITDE